MVARVVTHVRMHSVIRSFTYTVDSHVFLCACALCLAVLFSPCSRQTAYSRRPTKALLHLSVRIDRSSQVTGTG
jgi:hypothetical protein